MVRSYRKLAVALATVLTAGVLAPLALSSAGAATTTSPVVPLVQELSFPYPAPVAGKTDVYAVHGLNLAGQTAQADRGTPVTVCAGGSVLIADFQFGDISPKVTLDSGSTVDIAVFAGANQPCTGSNPLISQSVTVPMSPVVALVATSGPGTFKPLLWAYGLQVATPAGCEQAVTDRLSPQAVVPPDARLQAAHAAAADQVDVLVNDTSVGQLIYGEIISQDVVAGTYKVQVNLNGTAIVGPTDVTLAACQGKVLYVVGNQPLPESTTTTTTTAPQTGAGNQVVTPAFTG